MAAGDGSPLGFERDARLLRALRRRLAKFLTHIPEKLTRSRDARVVRARLVDYRYLQPLGFRLAGAEDVHVEPVGPAIPVGVEIGLDPQPVVNPLLGIGKGGNHLRLPVLKDRLSGPAALRTGGRDRRRQADRRRRGVVRRAD